MQNVTIVGTENKLLILATESGDRFALAIDDVLYNEIRRARRVSEDAPPRSTVSPKEIQSHIRAGMTAPEVAELLSVDLAIVERFESPVLAEREHVVTQALAVPVLIGSELEPDAQPTFGVAVRAKLSELSATGERWASWKGATGWVIKLEFTANEVEHDARWGFDPRRSVLTPQNADATQLSRQGSLPEGLIPRLRAVDPERPASPYKDESRFDSGAFGPRLVPTPAPAAEPEDFVEEAPREQPSRSVQEAATNRAPEPEVTHRETADLLEALRRRRGQRETSPALDLSEPQDDRDDPISLFDALDAPDDTAASDTTADENPNDTSSRRRRRNTMPSWDEIVFGARSDD